MFVQKLPGNDFIILLLYINDILITDKNASRIDDITTSGWKKKRSLVQINNTKDIIANLS